MTRVELEDGRSFDTAKAEKFKEGLVKHRGRLISLATESSWEHQELYFTAQELLVLHSWSTRDASAEAYTELTHKKAAEWLLRNEYDEDSVPEKMRALLPAYEQSGMGRPRIDPNGFKLSVRSEMRFTKWQEEELVERAEAEGLGFGAYIRKALFK